MPVQVDASNPVASITLDDPRRHNALNVEMFDALEDAVAMIEQEHEGPVLRLRGAGDSFCSGFDLDACQNSPTRMDEFLLRLSKMSRKLRNLNQIVVAEVQGSALAGGCAIVGSCDFVCVSPEARLGYPVHRIGVSPAVSLPTLLAQVHPGHAGAFLLSGSIIDASKAIAIGLAHKISSSTETLPALVDDLCDDFQKKGWKSLRTTKAWVNTLTRQVDAGPFDEALAVSIETAHTPEAARLLSAFWSRDRVTP